MSNKIKYKEIGSLLWMVVVLFLVFFTLVKAPSVHSISSLRMNFSGKIVTSDGLDISQNPPNCVLESADICDFEIRFYDDESEDPGTLLGSEVFEDIEIGDYRGFFNLKIGGGIFSPGEYSSIKDIFLKESDVYIEVLFDGSGTSNFEFSNEELERFVVSHDPFRRMSVGTSPYSISSRGAIDDFQLKVKEGSLGDSRGLIYFDGAENSVKVHDGIEWRALEYFDEESLVWNISGDDIFFDSGSVGIGTDDPDTDFNLHVVGDSRFSGNIFNKLSDENLPEVLGGSASDLSSSSVFVIHGDYAFVGVDGAPATLDVYNIKTLSPSLVTSVDLIDLYDISYNTVQSISIFSDKGYIVADGRLLVLDLSDLNNIEGVLDVLFLGPEGNCATLEIGDECGGGIVAHKNADGGLIVSQEDQSPGMQWGCYGQSVGTTSTDYGTGMSNTETILSFHDDITNFGDNDYYTYGGDYGLIGCDDNNNGEVAAKTAREYEGGGYNDWFLPSSDELEIIYDNLASEGIGGFADDLYWSSSESVTCGVEYCSWDKNFANGDLDDDFKYESMKVRAARAFTVAEDYEALSLKVQGRFGYVLTNGGFFQVIDLSSSNLKAFSSTDLEHIGDFVDLAVIGRYVYILYEDSLLTVDVNDPSQPVISGHELALSFSASSATSFDASGRYAYITTSSNLYVVDLFDMSDVSDIALGVSNASEIIVSGMNAFVLDSSAPSTLLTLDISDVNNLVLFDSVTFSSTYDNGRSIRTQGKYGYALTDGGLAVFDMKGIETSSLLVNSFSAFSGFIHKDLSVNRDLFVSGGMQIGTGGIYTDGSLSVDGQVRIVGGLGVGTGESVYINEDGYLVAGSSSLRYKNNVESYGSVLSKLSNLDLVRFTWGDNTMSGGKDDVGMIAEEVAKYIPELVNFNAFGQPEGLKYDRMGAYAIAGLNELKMEFDEFKKSVKGVSKEQKVYTSVEEFEVGTLVSRDFSRENGLDFFRNEYKPLYGVVIEMLRHAEDSENESFEYKIASYSGFGDYEILIHRNIDSDILEIDSGTPLYVKSNGEISLLEDENPSIFLLGYTLEDLEFESNEYSKLANVYLTYTPLNFGFNSTSFTSLFSGAPDDDRLTFGGGHINFNGYRGSFDFLETKMLNVDDRIIIFVEEDDPKIKVDGIDLLERVSELEKELDELMEE